MEILKPCGVCEVCDIKSFYNLSPVRSQFIQQPFVFVASSFFLSPLLSF